MGVNHIERCLAIPSKNAWQDANREKCSCRSQAHVPGNGEIFFPGRSRVFRVTRTPVERLSRDDFV